jgi:hypothetical protein
MQRGIGVGRRTVQQSPAVRGVDRVLVLFFAPRFFYLVERHTSYDVHNVGDAYGWLFRTLFEDVALQGQEPAGCRGVLDRALRRQSAHDARHRVHQRGGVLLRRGRETENRQHFERTRAELVVSAELTGALLAAAARTHGLAAVIADLLTHPEGQELYRVPAPPEVAGQTVRSALEQMKDVHESLLVGVYDGDQCSFNPPSNTVIPDGADLLVVRERPIDTRY